MGSNSSRQEAERLGAITNPPATPEPGGLPGPLPLMGFPALCASFAARAACFDSLQRDTKY